MDNLDELRKEAEEAKERLRRDLYKLQDIFNRVAEEIGENGKSATGEAVRLAEKRIEETAFRVEKRIERAMALMTGDNVNVNDVITREMDYSDFTSIEVDCAFKVIIAHADSYRVVMRIHKALFDSVNITKSGNTLRLSLKPYRFRNRPTIEAKIFMPKLSRLRMGAATRGSVSGFNSDATFALNLSGGSSLDLDMEVVSARCEISGASRLTGKVKITDADLVLSGASRAELTGSAKDMTLSAWGASKADMENFTVCNANVNLKGASEATIDATDKLNVDLGSGSRLAYLGTPAIHEINVAGASLLNHR